MKLDRTTPRRIALYGGTMISRSSLLKLGLATLLLPTLAGCSPAPMPVSQSSKDPSSPSAPEGMPPLSAANAASPAPAATSTGHDHSAHSGHGGGATPAGDAGTEAVVYVCPMHPEVTSTTPGSVCPKCNMKLVPKK